MSTIKISELVEITHLNSNTSNTLIVGVDLPSGETGKITATTLAEGLYSFNPLRVGNNEILFPSTIAQFAGNSSSYLQVNLQNFDENGTGDYIVTADVGSDTTNYIDLGITNSNYDNSSPYNSLGTSVIPLDAYLYSKGDGAGSGNLVLGTISPSTVVKFVTGGINAENVSVTLSETGLTLNSGRQLTFGDSSVQTTAVSNTWVSANDTVTLNSAKSYTNSSNTQLKSYTDGAINLANTQLKSYTDGKISSANTQLQDYADGKFLANTTGVFGGTLLFTGNIDTNGFISIINSTSVDTTPLFKISAATNGASQPPSNKGYTIHTTSFDGEGNRIVADAFGAVANNYASFIGRRGRGTAESPTAIQSGDIIARFGGNGFGSTKFSQYGDGRIEVVAAENFTDTSKRTKIDFLTTTSGSNTATTVASFNGNTATFIGTIEPQKGFIYTPRVLVGVQTAITLDFTSDTIIKGTYTTGGVTITPTNFVAGKVVEVWLTNTAGNGQPITHGLTANNSTAGSTSVSVAAQRCAHLRYFSIDGDLANTFVTITYS